MLHPRCNMWHLSHLIVSHMLTILSSTVDDLSIVIWFLFRFNIIIRFILFTAALSAVYLCTNIIVSQSSSFVQIKPTSRDTDYGRGQAAAAATWPNEITSRREFNSATTLVSGDKSTACLMTYTGRLVTSMIYTDYINRGSSSERTTLPFYKDCYYIRLKVKVSFWEKPFIYLFLLLYFTYLFTFLSNCFNCTISTTWNKIKPKTTNIVNIII